MNVVDVYDYSAISEDNHDCLVIKGRVELSDQERFLMFLAHDFVVTEDSIVHFRSKFFGPIIKQKLMLKTILSKAT